MTEKKKRAAEGYTGSYETGAGTRWEWKATVTLLDDTRNVVHRSGFLPRKVAQKAMREALTASDKGGHVEPR